MFTDELSDKYVLVVEDLKDDIIKKQKELGKVE